MAIIFHCNKNNIAFTGFHGQYGHTNVTFNLIKFKSVFCMCWILVCF